jgi:hypothetical protein
MGLFSKVEHTMEDAIDSAGDKLFDSPISPVQIAKKCEKQMKRNKLVGAGKQYAPTLYTILVNQEDDHRLFSFYPTLAGETETYLSTVAANSGLDMDGNPLVRFVADADLKHGKFDVFAQVVASPIVEKLRLEENIRYGIVTPHQGGAGQRGSQGRYAQNAAGAPGAYGAYGAYNEPAYNGNYNSYGEFTDEDAMYNAPYEDSYGSLDDEYYEDGFNNAQNGAGYAQNQANIADLDAYLQCVNSGKTWKLSKAIVSVGREDGNDIVVADPGASREHARFVKREDAWYLEDLHSTNGTLVNKHPIERCALQDGSIITIGETDYEFFLQ